MTQLPDHFHDIPSGWMKILTDLHKNLVVVDDSYQVENVGKEYGQLRVRLKSETPKIWGIIGLAESISRGICEVCGAPGHRTTISSEEVVRCKSHKKEVIQWKSHNSEVVAKLTEEDDYYDDEYYMEDD